MDNNRMATADDISRLYDAINKHKDETNKAVMGLEVAVTRLNTILEGWPKPAERPCDQYKALEEKCYEHFEAHKAVRAGWQNTLMGVAGRLISKAIGMGVVGGIMYFALRK